MKNGRLASACQYFNPYLSGKKCLILHISQCMSKTFSVCHNAYYLLFVSVDILHGQTGAVQHAHATGLYLLSCWFKS